MHVLKGVFGFMLVLVVVAAFGLLVSALIYGVGFISALAMPIMTWMAGIAFIACLLLVPLSLIHKARVIVVHGLTLASCIFGLSTWMLGLIVTLELWGVVAVILGVLLAGVGVVPIGMLAAIFNASWPNLIELVVGVILTWSARYFALWVGQKYDDEEMRRRYKIVDGEVLR